MSLPETTRDPIRRGGATEHRPPLMLTIAWHADARRVGERLRLPAGRTAVGRTAPTFADVDGAATASLDDPFVSRRPAVFEVDPDGITLHPGGSRLVVQGEALDAPRRWTRAGIGHGLTVRVAERVLLLIHAQQTVNDGADHGLIGSSEAIGRLRLDIERAARLDVPVLLRGESGAGKELVARAVHAASVRSAAPYRAVNMAAIPESVAPSTLFGHRKGAFTGASTDRAGHFGETDGGTLFLDEIGDVAPAVQPMLLRALESGEIEPVGGRPRTVDVRVIAATDADLDAGVRDGDFRRPLLHRLAGYVIRVPTLRERPDDIPRLLQHFLRAELAPLGGEARLAGEAGDEVPWLDAEAVARLMEHTWPGNVRELRNVARRIAAAGFDRSTVPADVIDDVIGPRGSRTASAPTPHPVGDGAATETLETEAHTYSASEVQALLQASGWSVRNAASRIGVPKSTLLRYAQRTLGLRTAADIPDAEWRACVEALGADVDAIAARLKVSKRAAGMRLRGLGVTG